MADFVHLDVHSQYSIIDGLASIEALCEKAKKLGMSALALTDQVNLFGAIQFIKIAQRYKIKPIIGATLWLEPEGEELEESALASAQPLIVLCQNEEGYASLLRLSSAAYIHGRRHPHNHLPLLKRADFLTGAAGLMVLVQPALWDRTFLDKLRSSCGDRLYFSLSRSAQNSDRQQERRCLEQAAAWQIPVVATHPVLFLDPEDFEAHEARMAIQQGVLLSQRLAHTTLKDCYFKSAEEMQTLFADLPLALLNAGDLAIRCTVTVELGKLYLPMPPIPAGYTLEAYLTMQAQAGLEQRNCSRAEYQHRLSTELDVINSMGFAGYFLVVADFIAWAKAQDIPVGPGRGSGAGSLVAYVLGITDVDPLPYDLLFERFLNPERVSMPDFDIDFCMDHRDAVIAYVAQRYGRESVAQIATFGTMAAKAVIRDCGRILGHPYGFVDSIAKLVPLEVGMTLAQALAQEPLLVKRRETEEEVDLLLSLALKLEGVVRHVGKHAGGVVIAPRPLTEFAPIYCEQAEGSWMVQYDKDDIEAVGLLKFDFLGLKTLTIIHEATRSVNTQRALQGQPPLCMNALPLEDAETFALFKKAQTTAVFQCESRGMKELIVGLQPDTFEDIIALVALFRPGPLQSGMVDDFIRRKHGRASVEYLHPDLVPILKPTYGVILYQEQVMKIAQVLAGYTLGAADLLRRAMGKKKPEEMAQQRSIFMQGARERGVSESIAQTVFDLMEKFAGYGFNKSHSAAYAVLSYQTAWLKAHYPAHFMAAVLSAVMDHTDKVVVFLEEVRAMGLCLLPPDLWQSAYRFEVESSGALRYGLGAIKGVGEQAVVAIIQAREHPQLCQESQPSWSAFLNVLDLKKCPRKTLESFILSGACDSFGQERAVLWSSLEQSLKKAESAQQARLQGQQSLFADDLESDNPASEAGDLGSGSWAPWSLEERLAGERKSLGHYWSGHPTEIHQHLWTHLGFSSLRLFSDRDQGLKTGPTQAYRVVALVQALRLVMTKRGQKMAIVTLEAGERSKEAGSDIQTYHFDITVFPELYAQSRALLVAGKCVVAVLKAQEDPAQRQKRVHAEQLLTMDEACRLWMRTIRIIWDDQTHGMADIEALKALLGPGGIVVEIQRCVSGRQHRVVLGAEYSFMPSIQGCLKIESLFGKKAVHYFP